MLNRLRGPTIARDMLVALAIVALGLKLLFPPGFMPGTSLAQPVVFCAGHASMPVMVMSGMPRDGEHGPDKMPHGAGDHPCPFAGLGATPLAPVTTAPAESVIASVLATPAARPILSDPGRGMAAPPPPAHAPPALHA